MMYPHECARILENIINKRYFERNNSQIGDFYNTFVSQIALEAKCPAVYYCDGYFVCESCEIIEQGRDIELYDRDPQNLIREWNFKKWVVPFVCSPLKEDVLLFKYERKCQKCGETMSFETSPEEKKPLKCCSCFSLLEKEKVIFFD